MESLFVFVNLAVLPFWLLMILAPGWRVTQRVMASPLTIVWLPILYAGMVIPRLGTLLPLIANPPELEAIARLLGSTDGAVIGWIHFLAFDLFVGRWVYLDAQRRGVRWWVSSPVLFFVLMFGPLGLLGYLLLGGREQVGAPEDQEGVRAAGGAQ